MIVKAVTLFLSALALVGCVTLGFDTTGDLEERSATCPWDAEETELALEAFREEYTNKFIESKELVKTVQLNQVIDWVVIDCQTTFLFKPERLPQSQWNEDPPPDSVSGITDNPYHIRVGAPADLPIGRTSLFHELMHATLWAIYDDPDADHEKKKIGLTWTKDHTALVNDLDSQFM